MEKVATFLNHDIVKEVLAMLKVFAKMVEMVAKMIKIFK